MAQNTDLARHWTFLSNHGHVMIQLARDPNLRIRDIAEAVGITERSAQAILVDLEQGGYLTVTRVGRRNQYQINANSKFRHPAEDEKPISALLKIFS